MLRLILGGDKSGKSSHALRLFESLPGRGLVFGMGRARDLGFAAQILAHRQERAPELELVEPGLNLAGKIAANREAKLLIDSLDFWLFECLESGGLEERRACLLESLESAREGQEIVIVSTESGLGPLAADSLTRRFGRELGALNQAVASLAQEVLLVVAGLPLYLKKTD